MGVSGDRRPVDFQRGPRREGGPLKAESTQGPRELQVPLISGPFTCVHTASSGCCRLLLVLGIPGVEKHQLVQSYGEKVPGLLGALGLWTGVHLGYLLCILRNARMRQGGPPNQMEQHHAQRLVWPKLAQASESSSV